MWNDEEYANMENSDENDINDNDEQMELTAREALSVIRNLAEYEGLEGAEQIILTEFGPNTKAVLLEVYDSLLRKEI